MPARSRPALLFTEFLHARKLKILNAGFSDNKLRARAAAEAAGLRVPAILASYRSVAEIDFGALPDRFVLKPTNKASRRGVFPLQRQGQGYYDHFTRKLTDPAAIVAALGALQLDNPSARRPTMVAEEFIAGENGPDAIPFDYKLYTFDGLVELIIQIDRNAVPIEIAFLDRDFRALPLGLVKGSKKIAPGVPLRPTNWAQLIDVAQRLARSIDVPFISVDLYTTGADVFVGELTPGPGGPYYGMFVFSPELDARLGMLWSKALQRRGLPIPMITGAPPVAGRRSGSQRWTALLKTLRRALGRVKRRLASGR